MVVTRETGHGGHLDRAVALTPVTAWEDVVTAFLDAATDSPETRRSYARHVTAAFTAIGVQTVADVNGADLARWRAQVAHSDAAPATQAQALSALRSFLRWSGALGAHHLSGDVIRTALRTPRTEVRRPYTVLTEPEIRDLLRAAVMPRDRALLCILIGAGLRVSEVAGLDIRDVLEDHEGGAALYVRRGKGRKDRTVPIQPDVARAIRDYLAATGRQMHGDGPLFRAHDRAASKLPRDRLSARAVGDVVTDCVERAGIRAKRVSPHTCRHTFALRALRTSGDVVKVSKLLGHASLTTTQRYLDHLQIAELREIVPLLP